MVDCTECGPVPGERGHECNRCGRTVCWEHRRPTDHECVRRGGEASTSHTPIEGVPAGSVPEPTPPDERTYL